MCTTTHTATGQRPRPLLIGLALVLVLIGLTPRSASATDLLASLTHRRQEVLYYQADQLPNNLKRIIAETPLDDIAAHYQASRDPYVHFNLIIACAQRLGAQTTSPADRRDTLAFLIDRMHDGNPWVRCEAIYAIGLSQIHADNTNAPTDTSTADNTSTSTSTTDKSPTAPATPPAPDPLAVVQASFNDPSDFVFLHAVIAYHQTAGHPPRLSPSQVARFRRVQPSFGDNQAADNELDTWMRNGAPSLLPSNP